MEHCGRPPSGRILQDGGRRGLVDNRIGVAVDDPPGVSLPAEQMRDAQNFRPVVRPGIQCAEDEAAAICHRLDCLPLAIELAAMQVKAFDLIDLREHLNGRLSLLRDGPRDLPARLQTMRDAPAWSYDLLPAELQGPFHRLATFAGGCTLEAAQAVCGAAGQITPGAIRSALAALVDASLVQIEAPAGGRTRFRLLELAAELAEETHGCPLVDC